MKELIQNTTAYLTVLRDVQRQSVSHAYMLWFNDSANMRDCLKRFALALFGTDENSVTGKRILGENYPDCRFYPEDGKKIAVEGVSALIEDCALRPLEADQKWYILVGFDSASPVVQNKLLKILEEPPQNIHFLLGVTTTAPILDTVRSRVKTLTIPSFSPEQVESVLSRRFVGNKDVAKVAQSCGGVLGIAQAMLKGGWYEEVRTAAYEICMADSAAKAAEVSQKYGDTKYKNEILAEMQRMYFSAYASYAGKSVDEECGSLCRKWKKSTLLFALDEVTRAATDVKFNAFFAGMLYDFVVRIMEENNKWLKL